MQWASWQPPPPAAPVEPGQQPPRPPPHPARERISSLAPTLEPMAGSGGQQVTTSLNQKVAELISNATSSTNLAKMPPGWQPWL